MDIPTLLGHPSPVSLRPHRTSQTYKDIPTLWNIPVLQGHPNHTRTSQPNQTQFYRVLQPYRDIPIPQGTPTLQGHSNPAKTPQSYMDTPTLQDTPIL